MANGPTAVTPERGDLQVGGEPGPGGHEWTIPKCTHEN